MTQNQQHNVYIASCVPDGGIYQYILHDNGSLEYVRKTALDRPMYMTAKDHKMHIILRAPFDNGESGVVVYDIDDRGHLVNPGGIISTKGEVACHIAVEEGDVYCANYISGSIIKLPGTVIQHAGCGKNPKRQDKAHAHWVGFTPDKKYVCAVDLGVDTVFVYDRDLAYVSCAKVPEGHGARHVVFSDDGKYMFCANELGSTVSAFQYHDGRLCPVDTAGTLPAAFSGESTAAAIRIYRDKIYVSNRGHDSVSEMCFRDGKLRLERTIGCGGRSPRDFNFMNDFMIVTNENSDNVTVYSCKDGFRKVEEIAVPKPLCVL